MHPVLIVFLILLLIWVAVIAVFALEDRLYLKLPEKWFVHDYSELKKGSVLVFYGHLVFALLYSYYKNGTLWLYEHDVLFEQATELREDVLEERKRQRIANRPPAKQLRRMNVFDEYADAVFMAKMEISSAVCSEPTDRSSKRQLVGLAARNEDREIRDEAASTIRRLEIYANVARHAGLNAGKIAIGVQASKVSQHQLIERQRAVVAANKLTMERWLRNFDQSKKWLSVVLLQGMERNNVDHMLDKRPYHYFFINPNLPIFATRQEYERHVLNMLHENEDAKGGKRGGGGGGGTIDATLSSGQMKGMFSQKVCTSVKVEPKVDWERADPPWGEAKPTVEGETKPPAPPNIEAGDIKITGMTRSLLPLCPRNVVELFSDSTNKGRMVVFSNLPLPPQIFCAFEVKIQQVDYNSQLIKGIKKRVREHLSSIFAAVKLKSKLVRIRQKLAAKKEAEEAGVGDLLPAAKKVAGPQRRRNAGAEGANKAGMGALGAFGGNHFSEPPASAGSVQLEEISKTKIFGQKNKTAAVEHLPWATPGTEKPGITGCNTEMNGGEKNVQTSNAINTRPKNENKVDRVDHALSIFAGKPSKLPKLNLDRDHFRWASHGTKNSAATNYNSNLTQGTLLASSTRSMESQNSASRGRSSRKRSLIAPASNEDSGSFAFLSPPISPSTRGRSLSTDSEASSLPEEVSDLEFEELRLVDDLNLLESRTSTAANMSYTSNTDTDTSSMRMAGGTGGYSTSLMSRLDRTGAAGRAAGDAERDDAFQQDSALHTLFGAWDRDDKWAGLRPAWNAREIKSLQQESYKAEKALRKLYGGDACVLSKDQEWLLRQVQDLVKEAAVYRSDNYFDDIMSDDGVAGADEGHQIGQKNLRDHYRAAAASEHQSYSYPVNTMSASAFAPKPKLEYRHVNRLEPLLEQVEEYLQEVNAPRVSRPKRPQTELLRNEKIKMKNSPAVVSSPTSTTDNLPVVTGIKYLDMKLAQTGKEGRHENADTTILSSRTESERNVNEVSTASTSKRAAAAQSKARRSSQHDYVGERPELVCMPVNAGSSPPASARTSSSRAPNRSSKSGRNGRLSRRGNKSLFSDESRTVGRRSVSPASASRGGRADYGSPTTASTDELELLAHQELAIEGEHLAPGDSRWGKVRGKATGMAMLMKSAQNKDALALNKFQRRGAHLLSATKVKNADANEDEKEAAARVMKAMSMGRKAKGGPNKGLDAVAKLFGLKAGEEVDGVEKLEGGQTKKKPDVCPHVDLCPFVIGIGCKPMDHRTPPQADTSGVGKVLEPRFVNKVANSLRGFNENKMPGHFPLSLGFQSDGLIHVQEGIGDRSKKYYKTRNGQLRQGDTLTVLIDRSKGHVFFFKNGKIVEIEQQVSRQAYVDLMEPDVRDDPWDARYEDSVQGKMAELALQTEERDWKEHFWDEKHEQEAEEKRKREEDKRRKEMKAVADAMQEMKDARTEKTRRAVLLSQEDSFAGAMVRRYYGKRTLKMMEDDLKKADAEKADREENPHKYNEQDREMQKHAERIVNGIADPEQKEKENAYAKQLHAARPQLGAMTFGGGKLDDEPAPTPSPPGMAQQGSMSAMAAKANAGSFHFLQRSVTSEKVSNVGDSAKNLLSNAGGAIKSLGRRFSRQGSALEAGIEEDEKAAQAPTKADDSAGTTEAAKEGSHSAVQEGGDDQSGTSSAPESGDESREVPKEGLHFLPEQEADLDCTGVVGQNKEFTTEGFRPGGTGRPASRTPRAQAAKSVSFEGAESTTGGAEGVPSSPLATTAEAQDDGILFVGVEDESGAHRGLGRQKTSGRGGMSNRTAPQQQDDEDAGTGGMAGEVAENAKQMLSSLRRTMSAIAYVDDDRNPLTAKSIAAKHISRMGTQVTNFFANLNDDVGDEDIAARYREKNRWGTFLEVSDEESEADQRRKSKKEKKKKDGDDDGSDHSEDSRDGSIGNVFSRLHRRVKKSARRRGRAAAAKASHVGFKLCPTFMVLQWKARRKIRHMCRKVYRFLFADFFGTAAADAAAAEDDEDPEEEEVTCASTMLRCKNGTRKQIRMLQLRAQIKVYDRDADRDELAMLRNPLKEKRRRQEAAEEEKNRLNRMRKAEEGVWTEGELLSMTKDQLEEARADRDLRLMTEIERRCHNVVGRQQRYHVRLPSLYLHDVRDLAHYVVIGGEEAMLRLDVNFGTKEFDMRANVNELNRKLELARRSTFVQKMSNMMSQKETTTELAQALRVKDASIERRKKFEEQEAAEQEKIAKALEKEDEVEPEIKFGGGGSSSDADDSKEGGHAAQALGPDSSNEDGERDCSTLDEDHERTDPTSFRSVGSGPVQFFEAEHKEEEKGPPGTPGRGASSSTTSNVDGSGTSAADDEEHKIADELDHLKGASKQKEDAVASAKARAQLSTKKKGPSLLNRMGLKVVGATQPGDAKPAWGMLANLKKQGSQLVLGESQEEPEQVQGKIDAVSMLLQSKNRIRAGGAQDKDVSKLKAETLLPYHIEQECKFIVQEAKKLADFYSTDRTSQREKARRNKKEEADLERKLQLAEECVEMFDLTRTGETQIFLKRASLARDTTLTGQTLMPFGRDTLFGPQGVFAAKAKSARILDALEMFHEEVKPVPYVSIEEKNEAEWKSTFFTECTLRERFMLRVKWYYKWYFREPMRRLTQGLTEDERIALERKRSLQKQRKKVREKGEAMEVLDTRTHVGDVQANLVAKFWYYAKALERVRMPRLSERILESWKSRDDEDLGEWVQKARKRQSEMFIQTHKLDALIVEQAAKQTGAQESMLVLEALYEEAKQRKESFSIGYFMRLCCMGNYFESMSGYTSEARMMREHVLRHYSYCTPFLLHALVSREDRVALDRWIHGKTFCTWLFGRLLPWASFGMGMSMNQAFLDSMLGLSQKDKEERRIRSWLRQARADALQDDDPFVEFDSRNGSFHIARRQNARFLTADMQKNVVEKAQDWIANAGKAHGLRRSQDEITAAAKHREDPLLRRYDTMMAMQTEEDSALISWEVVKEAQPAIRRQEDFMKCRLGLCSCVCYVPQRLGNPIKVDQGRKTAVDVLEVCATCGHLACYHTWEPGRRLYHPALPLPSPFDVLDVRVQPDSLKARTLRRPSLWRKALDATGHRMYYNVKTQESQYNRPSTGQMGRAADWFGFGTRPDSTERCPSVGGCARRRPSGAVKLAVQKRYEDIKRAETQRQVEIAEQKRLAELQKQKRAMERRNSKRRKSVVSAKSMQVDDEGDDA
ncbi:unnamed protein product [Amoebophrya sp. A25]|nr:unnamed protein product [Amoebophrya sp. A25]|eukprot:GSA25T00018850001.1